VIICRLLSVQLEQGMRLAASVAATIGERLGIFRAVKPARGLNDETGNPCVRAEKIGRQGGYFR
jgi:hypothetical protein